MQIEIDVPTSWIAAPPWPHPLRSLLPHPVLSFDSPDRLRHVDAGPIEDPLTLDSLLNQVAKLGGIEAGLLPEVRLHPLGEMLRIDTVSPFGVTGAVTVEGAGQFLIICASKTDDDFDALELFDHMITSFTIVRLRP
ncbi:hypothetical protein F8O06_04965 [Pseudoclavibacter sp. CFCC 14310]|nr:hypothetical protein F8O06_07480 [Pseudoclavibacter sp. CFCC 14310]KAB1646116.1 hypothetical protein F8O06_04965 [Pseudoclavibacter sp. CFCC 14310]